MQRLVVWIVGICCSLMLVSCGAHIASSPPTPSVPPAPTVSPTRAEPAPTAPAVVPAHPAMPLPAATQTISPSTYPTRTLAEVWSFATSGNVDGSPVANDNQVFVAASDAGVFALATDTGTQAWHIAPPEGVWGRSLALAGQVLLVGLPGEILVGLDTRTGQEVWRTTLVGDVQRPPLVAGDMLYVGTTFVGPGLESQPERKAFVYALRISDGSAVWSFETDTYLIVTPALDGTTLYAGGSYYDPAHDIAEGGPMRVYAFDATSGTPQWSVDGDAGLIKRIAASGTLVTYLAYQDRLFALDTRTGASVWTYHTENWTPDFLVDGDTIYFGVGNGFAHAVDATSGEQRWKTRLDVFRRPIESPVLVGGTLYLLVAQQQIFLLDAQSGAILGVAEHPVMTREGLVITSGLVLLVGTDGTLHAFALPS